MDRQNQHYRPHRDLGDLKRGTDWLESASAGAREWNKKTCGRSNTEVLAPARPSHRQPAESGGLDNVLGAKERSESPESATGRQPLQSGPQPAVDLGRGRSVPIAPQSGRPGAKGQLRSSCAQRRVQPARATSRGPGIRTATSAAILEASRPQAEPLRGSPAPGAPNPGTCAPVFRFQRAKAPRAGRVRPVPPGSTSPPRQPESPTLRERLLPMVPGPPLLPLPPGPASRA